MPNNSNFNLDKASPDAIGENLREEADRFCPESLPILGRKEKTVVLREGFLALTGNPTAAMLLNQLVFWQGLTKDVDQLISGQQRPGQAKIPFTGGWMSRSALDLIEDTMLTCAPTTMLKYVECLVKGGWVEWRHSPTHKYERKKQYRVNIRKVADDLARLGFAPGDWWLPGGRRAPASPFPKNGNGVSESADAPPKTADPSSKSGIGKRAFGRCKEEIPKQTLSETTTTDSAGAALVVGQKNAGLETQESPSAADRSASGQFLGSTVPCFPHFPPNTVKRLLREHPDFTCDRWRRLWTEIVIQKGVSKIRIAKMFELANAGADPNVPPWGHPATQIENKKNRRQACIEASKATTRMPAPASAEPRADLLRGEGFAEADVRAILYEPKCTVEQIGVAVELANRKKSFRESRAAFIRAAIIGGWRLPMTPAEKKRERPQYDLDQRGKPPDPRDDPWVRYRRETRGMREDLAELAHDELHKRIERQIELESNFTYRDAWQRELKKDTAAKDLPDLLIRQLHAGRPAAEVH